MAIPMNGDLAKNEDRWTMWIGWTQWTQRTPHLATRFTLYSSLTLVTGYLLIRPSPLLLPRYFVHSAVQAFCPASGARRQTKP